MPDFEKLLEQVEEEKQEREKAEKEREERQKEREMVVRREEVGDAVLHLQAVARSNLRPGRPLQKASPAVDISEACFVSLLHLFS